MGNVKEMTNQELISTLNFAKEFINNATEFTTKVSLKSAWKAISEISAEMKLRNI